MREGLLSTLEHGHNQVQGQLFPREIFWAETSKHLTYVPFLGWGTV